MTKTQYGSGEFLNRQNPNIRGGLSPDLFRATSMRVNSVEGGHASIERAAQAAQDRLDAAKIEADVNALQASEAVKPEAETPVVYEGIASSDMDQRQRVQDALMAVGLAHQKPRQ